MGNQIFAEDCVAALMHCTALYVLRHAGHVDCFIYFCIQMSAVFTSSGMSGWSLQSIQLLCGMEGTSAPQLRGPCSGAVSIDSYGSAAAGG